jgi:hypothetical protein
MHTALEFVQFAKDQMGVEIFMLAGWKDAKGQFRKAKLGQFIYLLLPFP